MKLSSSSKRYKGGDHGNSASIELIAWTLMKSLLDARRSGKQQTVRTRQGWPFPSPSRLRSLLWKADAEQ
jgi:hypothetical protein